VQGSPGASSIGPARRKGAVRPPIPAHHPPRGAPPPPPPPAAAAAATAAASTRKRRAARSRSPATTAGCRPPNQSKRRHRLPGRPRRRWPQSRPAIDTCRGVAAAAVTAAALGVSRRRCAPLRGTFDCAARSCCERRRWCEPTTARLVRASGRPEPPVASGRLQRPAAGIEPPPPRGRASAGVRPHTPAEAGI
jgi:hypothetical protein